MNKVEELQFKLQLLLGEKYIVKCWAEGASSAITRRPLFKVNVYIYKGTKLVYMDHQKIDLHTVREANFDKLEERVYSWYKDPFVNFIRNYLLMLIFLMAVIGTIGSFLILFFLVFGLRTIVDISWWIVIPTVGFLFYYYCYKMYGLIFK